MVDDFKGRGGSPWGSPPGGGGNGGFRRGPTPPNIDEIVKNIQDKIEQQLKQARSDASEFIKSSSASLQDKAQIEISKLEKELDDKINDSSEKIEKSKNESLKQIQSQINEITKLTLSKVASFDVTDDEIKNAVKNSERSLN